MSEPAAAAPSRRKARAWTRPVKPPLADLLRAGDRRRLAVKAWLRDPLADLYDYGMYGLFRILPTDRVSDIGARLGRRLVRPDKPTFQRGIGNMRRLTPGLDRAGAEAAMLSHAEHVGRLYAEFAVMDRVLREERVEIVGEHHLDAAESRGPVILALLHTGNWEVAGPVVGRRARQAWAIYAPPASEAKHRIAVTVRERAGVRLLPPGMAGARPAMQALERGETLILLCDEAIDGRLMGPFFGRPPHLEGNMARACRLARRFRADIVPAHVERREGARFRMEFHPAVTMRPDEDLVADVLRLDAAITPPILRNLDQWYFVDSRWEPPPKPKA